MALSAPRPGFRSGRAALFLWRLAAGAALLVALNGWACIPSAADEKVNEGNAYFEKGDYRKARTRYHQAIALDPGNAKAYYALGVIAYTQGSYGSAVVNFRRAIGLNSRDADFWFYLGNSYAQMGKYQEAVDAYEQVVALDRLYADIYYARGVAHYNLRQWDYALRDFESYLRYSPDGDRRATAYQLIDSLKKGGVKPAEEQAPAAGR